MMMINNPVHYLSSEWYAEDLGEFAEEPYIKFYSAHKEVINFIIDNQPQLLMIAGEGLAKGPATVGLNENDFRLLSGLSGGITGGKINSQNITIECKNTNFIINRREGKSISFAPTRYSVKNLSGLLSAHTFYHSCLRKQKAGSNASAVLLGHSGGELYFRERLLNYYPQTVKALIEGNSALFLESAVQLAGMGKGFTPTGDDLISAGLLSHHYFNYNEDVIKTIKYNSIKLHQMTNIMGAHMITLGLAGLSGEPIHSFLTSLVKGKPDQALLKRLLEVGSSTGFDFASGILFYIDRLFK